MMETASISETSVNFYRTTRRNNPEESHLYPYIAEESINPDIFLSVFFSNTFISWCYLENVSDTLYESTVPFVQNESVLVIAVCVS
jgi:hypothetical protein